MGLIAHYDEIGLAVAVQVLDDAGPGAPAHVRHEVRCLARGERAIAVVQMDPQVAVGISNDEIRFTVTCQIADRQGANALI